MIRAEDFTTWLVEGLEWNWGLIASYHEKPLTRLTASNGIPMASLLSTSKLDFDEVEKEKEKGEFEFESLRFIVSNIVSSKLDV